MDLIAIAGLEITKKNLLVWGTRRSKIYLSEHLHTCPKGLLVQNLTMTRCLINRSDFKALVPRTSSWIFTCPRQEDNLFFRTLDNRLRSPGGTLRGFSLLWDGHHWWPFVRQLICRLLSPLKLECSLSWTSNKWMHPEYYNFNLLGAWWGEDGLMDS